jgi:phosphoglycolate phosphatase
MDALVLFDIDGTMITTGGAGMRAMRDAGRELYGPEFELEGVDFAGRLDPLLVDDIFARNNVPRTADERARFRRVYHRRLQDAPPLPPPHGSARALPGVHELLANIGGTRGVTLGVLTGNYQETAEIKLRACAIDPGQFEIGVFGDHSPHDPPDREHLPPVAMNKYLTKFGREIRPERVTVIGDTPHDVRCAKRNGCRSLAVATGKFSVEELQSSGADRAVKSLQDAQEIMSWLTSPTNR